MMNKIAFSIDLDDWYHSPLVCGANFSHYATVDEFFSKWEGRYDYLTDSTERLLNLLTTFDVKATIFVIADIVEKYPRLVEMLKSSGHEIACHSLHHTVPYHSKTKEQTQSKEEWERELAESIEILNREFGQEIIGYRAPGAFIADWMIPLLRKHGIKYDSSIAFNSLYNKTNTQLEDIPGRPYILDPKTFGPAEGEDGLLEIPWPFYKVGSYLLPGGGAYFFRLLGYNYFRLMLKQRLKEGDTVFYIHSIDVSDENFPLSNFRNRPFYWINKGTPTIKKLNKLLKAFEGKFTTCKEIYERNLTIQGD